MRVLGLAAVVLWLSVSMVLASAGQVYLITVDGAIGPATASYISRAVDETESQHGECLIIQLNTPGGLLDSMQRIVQKLLASHVPVIG